MRLNKILAFLLICALGAISILAAGCGPGEEQSGDEVGKEITITDSTGEEIVFAEVPARVVVLNPPAAEVLRILQIPEMLKAWVLLPPPILKK